MQNSHWFDELFWKKKSKFIFLVHDEFSIDVDLLILIIIEVQSFMGRILIRYLAFEWLEKWHSQETYYK